MYGRIAMIGVALFTVLGAFVSIPLSAGATHNATSCKWDFPWPHQVEYWIEQGTDPTTTLTSAEATRVSYGPATWSEGNFNLYFTRVSTAGQSEGGNSFIAKGTIENPNAAAETYSAHYGTAGSNCNVDQGRALAWTYTVFDQYASWNLDCNANHSTCITYDQFDLHDIASHELGHWFAMGDISDSPSTATMWYAASAGEYYKRDLDQHDKDSAWVMYGCRNGATCH